MVDKEKFDSEMKKCGYNLNTLAIAVSKQTGKETFGYHTLRRKVLNETEFTATELFALRNLLKIRSQKRFDDIFYSSM